MVYNQLAFQIKRYLDVIFVKIIQKILFEKLVFGENMYWLLGKGWVAFMKNKTRELGSESPTYYLNNCGLVSQLFPCV